MKYFSKVLSFLLISLFAAQPLFAQQIGDFRSNASGDWSNKAAKSKAVNQAASGVSQAASQSTSTWQQFQAIGGVNWTITAQSNVPSLSGNTLSQNTFTPGNTWQSATVPGTILNSYIVNGTLPEPNTDSNVYTISKSTYNKPYWYRAAFTIPASFNGRTVWLNFNGINKTADIYLNGTFLGTSKGLMQRQKIKFTPVEGTNVLAVLVSPPTFSKGKHDLANQESPTYICSQGWDWMPQVPGLNSGITDEVYLSSSAAITIEDPWIRTTLPAPYTNASVNVRIQLKNNTGAAVTGDLNGVINPGGFAYSVKAVSIPANGVYKATTTVAISNPILWWPNGYGGNPDGTQQVYKCYTEFKTGTILSDSTTRSFGIRNVTFNNTSNTDPLKVTVNGQPVFCKGGNWGMSEYLLRTRGKEYDTRVRFHKEMNFNMIRNWTGETTDEEFYAACDKYGLMIFDDFWLNNNGWIQDADTAQFRSNVIEKIKKFRNHPAIVLWCGANEGVPGYGLDSKENRIMAQSIAAYDNNDRRYQPRSNNRAEAGVGPYLSGSGSWSSEYPSFNYFLFPANGYAESTDSYSFRTEIGTAVVPNAESIRKFITSPSNQWPSGNLWDNDLWKKHMFSTVDSLGGGARPDDYVANINLLYGTSSSLDQFTKKAQLQNLEANKAIFEGWQDRLWNDATGVLLWMSQSAYPSMIWQTYDYYFDLTGAYFGSKKACEPVHIQWNGATNSVKVINNKNSALANVKAEAIVYDKTGKIIPGYYQTTTVPAVGANAATEVLSLFGTILSNGKPVTASSATAGFSAAYVTDGKARTCWKATSTSPTEYIQVDLQAVAAINSVRIVWEKGPSFPTSYKIQVANDAQGPWVDATQVSGSKGGVNNIQFKTISGRYVRMQPTASQFYAYSMFEFEVFGPAVRNASTLNTAVTASSTSTGTPQAVTDGDLSTRWSSNFWNDNENITIDLGSSLPVTGTKLTWEAAYATAYKIQVATSLSGPWTDALLVSNNTGGTDSRTFAPTTGRYVRMQGVSRALNMYGYSLYEFEVYTQNPAPLTDVSFIKLRLTEQNGSSYDNFYWYGNDYTGLNTMPAIGTALTKSVATTNTLANGNKLLTYTVTNTSTSNAAFGIRAQMLNGAGQQILPAIVSDSYFSLMQGESKKLTIEVDPAVLGSTYSLDLKPYNN